MPLTPILGQEEHRQIGALRARLALIAQLLLKLDPHSEEALDPALFRKLLDALSALLGEARTAASRLLFGMEPEAFLKNLHEQRLDLRGWAKSHAGTIPAAHLLLSLLAEPRPPEADVQFLPERSEIMTPDFAEEIAYRLLNDSGFDMAPFWLGSPRLTGALSRMRNDPVVRNLLISEGISPAALTGARIVETAGFFARAEGLLNLSAKLIDRAMPKDGESAPAATTEEDGRNVLWTYGPEAGIGISFVETARGLLMHAVKRASFRRSESPRPPSGSFRPTVPASAWHRLQRNPYSIRRTTWTTARSLKTQSNGRSSGLTPACPPSFNGTASGEANLNRSHA